MGISSNIIPTHDLEHRPTGYVQCPIGEHFQKGVHIMPYTVQLLFNVARS